MRAFQGVSEALVAAVEAGASIAEAAESLDIPTRTCRGWLEKGRKAPDGRYGAFAARIDAALTARRLPTAAERAELDEDELRALVAAAARRGNVAAMRLYADRWLTTRPDEPSAAVDPLAEVDEIAQARLRRAR